ncbi:transposase [Nocardia stercoris]|uniref:transposase n=1 Tax=Nocardia stercoris TaxID=2483361 RepID=UPI00389943D7
MYQHRGFREILGIQVTSGEDGGGWLALFRHLVARGLAGVHLVTCHAGLVAAIDATLPARPGNTAAPTTR